MVCETWGQAVAGVKGQQWHPPLVHAGQEQPAPGVGLSETSMQKCLAETEMFAPGGRILLCFQADSFNLGFSSVFLLQGVA